MTTEDGTASLSFAVLTAIADRLEEDGMDVPPLDNAINPDALDALFAPKYDGTPRGDGRVTFSYAGYTVTVHSDGRVELREQRR